MHHTIPTQAHVINSRHFPELAKPPSDNIADGHFSFIVHPPEAAVAVNIVIKINQPTFQNHYIENYNSSSIHVMN